ncbi:MAG: PilZ domain-containing protein [Candidatus Omnitrophota bacterium]
MEERREWKRYSIAYPIDWGKGSAERTFIARNVSKGGAAFTAKGKGRKNEKVVLQIFLKNRMFNVEALIVHAKQLKEDQYEIGVKFLNASEEFLATLEKESDEITQFHRECNLYNHKNLSFSKASTVYLKNTPPSNT